MKKWTTRQKRMVCISLIFLLISIGFAVYTNNLYETSKDDGPAEGAYYAQGQRMIDEGFTDQQWRQIYSKFVNDNKNAGNNVTGKDLRLLVDELLKSYNKIKKIN